MKKKIGLIALLIGLCAFGFAACKEEDNSSSVNTDSSITESSSSIDNGESSSEEKPEAHVHKNGETWFADGEGHWQVCECGEKMNSSQHEKGTVIFSDGKTEWYKCVICDSKIEETAHTHAYGDVWIANGIEHWNECTLCGDKSGVTAHSSGSEWFTDGQSHWKKCSVCDTRIESGAHTPSGEYSVLENTHVRGCSVCGKDIENLHMAKAALSTDGEYHWSECECGKILEKVAHSIGKIDISDPQNGKMYCVCGAALGSIKTLLPEIYVDLNAANGEVKNTTATVDLNQMTNLSVEVVSAALGETALTGTTADNVYTFDLTSFDSKTTGEMEFVATVNLSGQEITVRAPAVVATKVLYSIEDLALVSPKSNTDEIYGYYVLGGDIDGNGTQLEASKQIGQERYGFRGTFDGRGYTVSNFNTGNYGIFGNIANGAVIKNVTFEVNKAGSNVLAYAARAATIENVNVRVESVAMPDWYECIAEINKSTIKNLTVKYSGNVVLGNARALCKTYAESTFENVKVYTLDSNAIVVGNLPEGVTVEYLDDDATAYYVEGANGNVTLKSEKFTVGDSVKANGVSYTVGTAGELTIALSDMTIGKRTSVVVVADDYELLFSNVLAVTKIITRFDELSSVMITDASQQIFGYYVLGCDLDGNGAQLADSVQIGNQNNGFRGTFDGAGHTISNFNIGNYGIFGNIAYGAVIKDVTFEVNKAGSNVLAYAARAAKIENVNVTVASVAYASWCDWISEINNSTVTNVTLTYDASILLNEGAFALCEKYDKSTFTNVTVEAAADTPITKSGAPDGVTVKYYE